jgi:hypothetical protein
MLLLLNLKIYRTFCSTGTVFVNFTDEIKSGIQIGGAFLSSSFLGDKGGKKNEELKVINQMELVKKKHNYELTRKVGDKSKKE